MRTADALRAAAAEQVGGLLLIVLPSPPPRPLPKRAIGPTTKSWMFSTDLSPRSLVVPVDEGEETRFRLLEPVRPARPREAGCKRRGRPASPRTHQLVPRPDDSSRPAVRQGGDQMAWPVAKRELPNLRACFGELIEWERVDDAERFVVAAFGPIACRVRCRPAVRMGRLLALGRSTLPMSARRQRQCARSQRGRRRREADFRQCRPVAASRG